MIKGILFDKDGTLINFQTLWLGAAKYVVNDFCLINHLPNTEEFQGFLLKVMGVENDAVRQDGPLAYMTYEQIGEALVNALGDIKLSKEVAGKQMKILFETVMEREELTCVKTCDLHTLLNKLKSKNIKVGLATADNQAVTKKCLDQLRITQEFEFLGCDDGILKPKPEPDIFEAFCKKYNLKPNEVAVVGDTVNDMRFAKNSGGKAIGVLCGLSRKEDFEPIADVIIKTPEKIIGLIESETL